MRHSGAASPLHTPRTSGGGNGGQQLLVVYYVPEQPEQRVERELQQRERQREQQEQQLVRCRARRIVIGSGEAAGESSSVLRPFASYANLYSFERLWRAYRECRRNKRNTLNALAFEIDAEAGLLELQRELLDHSYRPGRRSASSPTAPSRARSSRRISATALSTTCWCGRSNHVFEPRFIHDSYACRKGKGVLAASDRLMEFLRRITGQRPAAGVGDQAGRRELLSRRSTSGRCSTSSAGRFADPELRWLTGILFHDPTADYHFKPGVGRAHSPSDERQLLLPVGDN